MAGDAASQLLLPKQNLDPAPEIFNTNASSKRRLRRCKTAPNGDFGCPDDGKCDESLPPPHPISIFSSLHPSFRRVFMFLAIYLGIGTLCFYFVRNQVAGIKTDPILDAVYFCVVTMTTVGYGDLVPNSAATKLLACVFVFSGMVLISFILSKAADYLVEKQEMLLVKAIHMRRKVGPTEIFKETETNRARYKVYVTFSFLLVLAFIGTTFLATVEKLDLVDAFYCVCATMTGLGYGDKSFKSEVGRTFAVFWILTITICLAQLLLYVAELNTETRQRELAKWVLTRRTTNTDLEAADLDHDGVVSAAEFIIYKLKEMGKISQEDISLVMEEFEELDYDQSGTLTISDISLAQSS